ncbi:MFS transporter [Nocardioides convexus]|uniref:MFS transporter n=1 Tax=Nocardioides convexus TaxID=2712224 RepID=UPI0024185169|nr:MFS transporter [Nocardioides convexus]
MGALLRPDPLLLAQEQAAADAEAGLRTVVPLTGSSWSRAVAAVRERPVLGYAIGGLALTHATMIGVMVMTPLHMEHGGSGLEVIGIVISVHVLGMFAFSPLVGLLADRFGRPPVLGAGGAVLLVALLLCASAPSGMSWQVTAGLFLLGLGWSLAMVSASTMVAEHAPLEARTDVQGRLRLGHGHDRCGRGCAGRRHRRRRRLPGPRPGQPGARPGRARRGAACLRRGGRGDTPYGLTGFRTPVR